MPDPPQWTDDVDAYLSTSGQLVHLDRTVQPARRVDVAGDQRPAALLGAAHRVAEREIVCRRGGEEPANLVCLPAAQVCGGPDQGVVDVDNVEFGPQAVEQVAGGGELGGGDAAQALGLGEGRCGFDVSEQAGDDGVGLVPEAQRVRQKGLPGSVTMSGTTAEVLK